MTLQEKIKELNGLRGKKYWRSLEELVEDPSFQEQLKDEFPEHASYWPEDLSRRDTLKLMGASLALAVFTSCSKQADEKIVPYVIPPEIGIPGKPLYFATSISHAGYATGVIVKSHQGRPTKIEGNPEHPASLGSTDIYTQAALLSLYDPARTKVVTKKGRVNTWTNFLKALAPELDGQKKSGGSGLRILSGPIFSPTLAAQRKEILEKFPQARWHIFEPANRDQVRLGSQMAFGEIVDSIYRFDRADVILSLEGDFLTGLPGHTRYARDYSVRRRVNEKNQSMNRVYAVESTPTLVGSNADHRLALEPDEMVSFAVALAKELGVDTGGATDTKLPERARSWIGPLARDLQSHPGRTIVVAGDQQPAALHGLVHAINAKLGNHGKTVLLTAPAELVPENHEASLESLCEDLDQEKVDVCILLESNPVYSAPRDLLFGKKLRKAGFSVHLSLVEDETGALCDWHVPMAHELESWSDARAYDGTYSILQPLISPLYGGKSTHEFLDVVAGNPQRSSRDLLEAFWKKELGAEEFDKSWRRILHDGFLAGSASPEQKVTLKKGGITTRATGPGGVHLLVRPHPTIWDGRYTDNAWLQELPEPISKLTWENAAWISPALAREKELENGDIVELVLDKRSVEAPIWIQPGQAHFTVTIHLGYGRGQSGPVAEGLGFSAQPLQQSQNLWQAEGLQIRKTGRKTDLATTQKHHSMEGRNLIQEGKVEDYYGAGHAEASHHGPHPSFYPDRTNKDGHAWGLTIDLNSCVGCGGCTLACQAENNIPVVGKDQVLIGRELHWIRVDRYFSGELDDPETAFQPVPCMHCENAPCEPVCPVAATVHSDEGLNDMVYNRCVGTRYCSNNCPYKVRRFNFFDYSGRAPEKRQLMQNPDVTIRSRGVMEKCTYCVQRINAARIEAKKENRPIRDGEVVTACQAACPTQAIVFGDINDPGSKVSLAKEDARDYHLLDELNTKPRTSYGARLKNPNPEMPS